MISEIVRSFVRFPFGTSGFSVCMSLLAAFLLRFRTGFSTFCELTADLALPRFFVLGSGSRACSFTFFGARLPSIIWDPYSLSL